MPIAFIQYLQNVKRKVKREGAEKAREVSQRKEKNKVSD